MSPSRFLLLRVFVFSCVLHAVAFCCALPGRAQVSDAPPTLPQERSEEAELAERSPLAEVVQKTIDTEGLQNGFWGLKVADAATGAVYYEREAGKRFVPASNVKLYTAAAALDQLGPDYRFTTRLYRQGPVVNDTLRGDLIVRGSGDPTIGGYEQRDDRLQVFRAWVDSLRAAGIQHVAGRVLGDDDVHTDAPLGHGWAWDDLPYRYAPELSGLSFAENLITLTARGQDVGEKAVLSWDPLRAGYVNAVNRSLTVRSDADEEYRRLPGNRTLYVESRVLPGGTQKEKLSVGNPTGYFVHVLRTMLERNSISVEGAAVDADHLPEDRSYSYEDPFTRVVARYRSAPLSKIVETMMEESQNLYAEQVLRTLGAERPVASLMQGDPDDPDPGSGAMGVEAALRTFGAAGVDTSRIRLADGSGLSRYDMVTPTMTAALLLYMRQHPDPDVADAFTSALAVGGRTGTLEYRFKGGPAEANVRAKTGTLSGVSALSGYVTTAGGQPLVFVIMTNHYSADTDEARDAIDRIVQAMAAGEV
ncbi:MAG: D-alanyl-D-alanine carboxypeptidase/D-alanyl-D-alanine-endopeptidase [Bacteroidetes bacterium SW_4_67_19]|nr:MAG: D-alanyl-D-alanine carboxypeptidase/D-alanyl-D-alanine-endopeptidase [Bacteroidetes bacterium SW_4_67_19]